MTMKDSKVARQLEEITDSKIISLMKQLKNLAIDKEASEARCCEPHDEMSKVLDYYSDIIDQLADIAENISKTSEAEESHAGTVFMGSAGDGTYLPEITDTFDAYVMEEDSQFEMQETLETASSEDANTEKKLLMVIPTNKPGFFLVTWTEYGLKLKKRHEAKQGAAQTTVDWEEEDVNLKQTSSRGKPIFYRLVEYSEEIEHEGEKIQVISPFKIRQGYLANPPTSIQGYPVWFRMQDQNSPAIALLTEESKEDGAIKKTQVTDLVLGIRTTMPCLDASWIRGKQSSPGKWMTDDLLTELQANKCFVVAKSWEADQENLALWRISFSGVERHSVKSLPREPKTCLLIMKAIRRKFLSNPKSLVTYHLKTILFYYLDKTGSDWKTSDRARHILALLESLALALKTKLLPLYFLPALNTLHGMETSTAAELEKKTREIISSPRILMSDILFQCTDELHNKECFQKGKEEVVVWFDEKPPEPKMFDDDYLED